ncbi:MAG: RHS repeat-associated core domain-containing protein [Chloroflexi bacterium]|nr:RHS repeat-associated core domain-containing protein [Chloroflexota bacterium]
MNERGLDIVRQLADSAGAVTLARRYDPFGDALSSAGSGTSAFGFAGEQTDATGLEYLRARYYAPGQGRFMTKDTWGGDYNQPMSYDAWLYAYANPVNASDPSGFDSGSPRIPMLPWEGITARQAVDFFRWVYSKKGPITGSMWPDRRFDCTDLRWSKPQRAVDIFADFLCERGPETVEFDGRSRLTKELAESVLLDQVRYWFYLAGPTSGPRKLRFNKYEAYVALYDQHLPADLPIFHVLGSVDYEVYRNTTGRVEYRIANRMDLASGTHIPERFPPENEGDRPLTLEQVVNENPALENRNLVWLLDNYRDAQGNPIVAILRPKARSETGGLGGGRTTQIFMWSEQYQPCITQIYWPFYVWLGLLDIR